MRHERALLAASLLALLTAAAGCEDPRAQTALPEWPLELQSDGARIVLYQPEPETLRDDELTARAAVSVQRPQDAEPVFGAAWLQARVATDRDARTVTVLDVHVMRAIFPTSVPEAEGELVGLVDAGLADLHHTFSLDVLEATLDQAQAHGGADGLATAPPRIVFTTTPTALISIDGEPRLQAVPGSAVQRVVNTPFVILLDPADGSWHLRQDRRWVRAAALQGPWEDEPDPPAAVAAALPEPQVPPELDATAPGAALPVLVVTEPTELIASDGEPAWTPIEGNELLSLANSDSDVFLDVAMREYYVLLSGRWYRSTSLEHGPWSWVAADDLPGPFSRIPADSERGHVRAFVAGTEEARDAVLDASVPQTSAIARDGPPCQVSYDGEPQFAPIEGTRLHYAVNTAQSVIECDGLYYCCQDAVWYVSESPLGPWAVCTAVPDEIYRIPPSCPLYPVTYVHVYEATPEVVYVGYLPGYTGCYVYGPTIVYGTGWWYPGWYGSQYYPYPCTWGYGAFYNPWSCDWLCGPGFGWGSSPWWFGCCYGWCGPGWWGPGGFHCDGFDLHDHGIQPHPPVAGAIAQGLRRHEIQTHAGHHNLYQRGANVARNAAPPESARVATAAPARTQAGELVPNDVFVDRDGSVLRRTPLPGSRSTTPRPTAPGSTLPGTRPTTPGFPPTLPPFTRPDPPGTLPPVRPFPPPRATPPMPRPPVAPPVLPPSRPSPGPGSGPGPRPGPTPPRSTLPSSSSALPQADIERQSQSRERGNSRASGFRERAGSSGNPRSGPSGKPR